MATRKRRVRSPHPGVKLKKRTLASGAVTWRAVYECPDTRRDVYVTLDRLALPTAGARTQWAKSLAADIARTRMDRAAGIEAAASRPLPDALARYMKTARQTLKPKTLEGHDLAHRQFLTWAQSVGVRETGDLTRALLVDLRDALIAAPRQYVERGGRQGARVAKKDRRSPVTVNRELRSLKTLLNTWRKLGMLEALHADDITDSLSALPVPRDEPDFLAAADLQKLLAAALRHDEATFAATRTEHAGNRAPGSTRRHPPIAPFVAVSLITGMRRGEALAVEWSMVDLDALDAEGRRVGEIKLPAAVTKTNRGRTIGLEVSPALRKILAAMRIRAGGRGLVFGDGAGYTVDMVVKARRRLLKRYGAPEFSWQSLRSTCGTFLTNAPGVFGSASAHLSARQLGHSIAIAERHYLGVHRGIPREARTLDAAMQIEGELAAVLHDVSNAGGDVAKRAAR